MQSKKDLSERDICSKYINPALEAAGWDIKTQIREELTFTDGRVYVKGNMTARGKKKRADYVLFYKPNIPIAIIEVKDNTYSVRKGMQQALEYGEILDIPCVFSTNGDGFVFHDRTSKDNIEKEIGLSEFPSPKELWEKYKKYKGIKDPKIEDIVLQDYFVDASGKTPRYYQQIAINRAVEAVAKGQDRILLVMATGTGKTYTAFQIIWRLWKARRAKRILFLADRNALIYQTKRGDFKHFKDKMTIIKKHQINKAFEVYLALYQGLKNYNTDVDAYKEFSKNFFDLIIIDECHRGSASEDSSWREILDYFSSAVQIGLTATPKETTKVSNIDYFGDPIYTYSLKQGINDGFLAPYKVIRVSLDRDLEGWRPSKGKKDKDGYLVEDRLYNLKDFDRTLVIDERTISVAGVVTKFLKESDRYSKTIIFCKDIDHAERMRSALINLNKDMYIENRRYIMQITGDNEEGKQELDNFTNPEEQYPVIATTSKLMTTGVDAKTCKVIVLDSNINSITEFKQIIGRGTRIDEDYGKTFFTIIDFRGVTKHFADPDFDGDPVKVFEPKVLEEMIPEELDENSAEIIDNLSGETVKFPVTYPEITGGGEIIKEPSYKIRVDGVEVKVVNQRVQYMDGNGKLITESLTDYTKTTIHKNYSNLDDFLTTWNKADQKKAIIQELEEQGILFDMLAEDIGKELDPFDLVCHIAFDMPPLTRKERAENVKKQNYFTKYGDIACKVLESLLDKYADEGIQNIESMEVLKLNPIRQYGSMVEIIKQFGGKAKYLEAIKDLEKELYKTTA